MNWRLLTYIAPEGLFGGSRPTFWLLMSPMILVVLFWSMGGTGFGKAVGADGARVRIEAGFKASYWAYRAAWGQESTQEKGYSFRGYIDRAQGDLILVYLYQGGGRKRLIVRLANVREGTVNVEDFAREYKGKNLRFDIYRLPKEAYPRAVIWQREAPLNLQVIEKSGGAELNPPTNVVDKIFARYYWRIAIQGR